MRSRVSYYYDATLLHECRRVNDNKAVVWKQYALHAAKAEHYIIVNNIIAEIFYTPSLFLSLSL